MKGSFSKVDPDMKPARLITVGRERLRQILATHDITFQRTRTWKESPPTPTSKRK
ncbi:hypothetical protein Kisp02_02420 [Kineosporia sp. NBRC 101731]|nr:hypothetical protein Kisp02_02420 [Kineosporia sp. NBRC 101731]